MNQSQFLSWLTTTLGLVGSALVTKGVIDAQTWTLISGIVLAIVPLAWGYFVHTDTSKITAVTDLGARIVVPDNSKNSALVAAANDTSMPNVTKAA